MTIWLLYFWFMYSYPWGCCEGPSTSRAGEWESAMLRRTLFIVSTPPPIGMKFGSYVVREF